MSFLLSIFSFETLRLPKRLSKAWTLATVIVIAASLFVQYLGDRNKMLPSNPKGLIAKYLADLHGDYDLWLLGNSTLANGVDEELLGTLTGKTLIKLPMGSATLNAQVQLAWKALAHAEHRPRTIICLISKDDVNANGHRARISADYIGAMSRPAKLYDRVTHILPIHAYRYSIRDLPKGLMRTVYRTAKRRFPKEGSPAPVVSTQNDDGGDKLYRDLSSDFDSEYLSALGQDYALDSEGLKQLTDLASQCNRSAVALAIVHPPVTGAILRWQDKYAPQLPWSGVQERIADEANRAGVVVMDFTNALPSTEEFFKDVYHLNARGREKFTTLLAARLNAQEVTFPRSVSTGPEGTVFTQR